MGKMAELVRQSVVDLIRRRKRLVSIPVKHRAKFEGWLQYELAAALDAHDAVQSVEPEKGYESGKRCDLACKTRRGWWFIELKTCNTNWRVDGVAEKARPIKMNVDGVINDIEKLRTGCPSGHGLSVFLFFPVPTAIWDGQRKGLDYHLNRIEREAKLPAGSLRRDGEFVRAGKCFGVAAFVVEVP